MAEKVAIIKIQIQIHVFSSLLYVSHESLLLNCFVFQDVEKELELQISMKQEVEMALRLLEKDIHEKQDTVVQLRKQLEDIKVINLEMYNKLQVRYSLNI